MIRKYLCSLIFLMVNLYDGISQVTFQKLFGGPANDYASACLQLPDSSIVIAGSTSSFGLYSKDGYLMKMSKTGDILWSKSFDLYQHDAVRALKQSPDGGFVIGGNSNWTHTDDDFFLIKTDSAGNFMWSSGVSNVGNDWVRSVEPVADGGYMLAGTCFWGIVYSGYLVKLDNQGNLLWSNVYSLPYNTGFSSMQATPDSGVVIFGAGQNSFLAKIDRLGNVVWSKTYSGNSGMDVVDGFITTDGGYIMTGLLYTGMNLTDICIIKTDSAGDTLWTKTYGGLYEDEVNDICSTSDGGYLLTSRSRTFDTTSFAYDLYVLKIDSSGNLLWSKIYGGNRSDEAGSSMQTFDGGYLIVGYSDSFNPLNYGDAYIIKTDSLGNSNCSAEQVVPIQTGFFPVQTSLYSPVINSSGGTLLAPVGLSTGGVDSTLCETFTGMVEPVSCELIKSISPNPADQSFKIEFNESISSGNIELINVLGVHVCSVALMNDQLKYISLENIADGMYFVKVTSGKAGIETLIVTHH